MHNKLIILSAKEETIFNFLVVTLGCMVLVEPETTVAARVIARCIQINKDPRVTKGPVPTITPCGTSLDCLGRYLCDQLHSKIWIYLLRGFHKANQSIVFFAPTLSSVRYRIIKRFHILDYA